MFPISNIEWYFVSVAKKGFLVRIPCNQKYMELNPWQCLKVLDKRFAHGRVPHMDIDKLSTEIMETYPEGVRMATKEFPRSKTILRVELKVNRSIRVPREAVLIGGFISGHLSENEVLKEIGA